MLSDQEAREKAMVAKKVTSRTLAQAFMLTADPDVQFTGVLAAAAFQASVLERIGTGMNREQFLVCAGDLFDSAKAALPSSVEVATPDAKCPCAKCSARREAAMAATAAEVPKEEAPSPAADAVAE